MKTLVLICLLGGALIVLISIVALISLWASGARILLLPGLHVVISAGALLGFLTALEAVFIVMAVVIWRS